MSDVFIPVIVTVLKDHSYLFIDYTKFLDIQSNAYNYI